MYFFVSTSKAGGDIAYWLSDHSEQEFNNPLVCKESLKLKIFLLLPVSVFPLLRIGMETAINEKKLFMEQQKNGSAELW